MSPIWLNLRVLATHSAGGDVVRALTVAAPLMLLLALAIAASV